MSTPAPDDRCGVCGAGQPLLLERYRGRACRDCEDQARCEAHGRPVEGFNTVPVPPWFWVQHRDDASRCDEASGGGRVLARGVACTVVEGRFGGTLVMPVRTEG